MPRPGRRGLDPRQGNAYVSSAAAVIAFSGIVTRITDFLVSKKNDQAENNQAENDQADKAVMLHPTEPIAGVVKVVKVVEAAEADEPPKDDTIAAVQKAAKIIVAVAFLLVFLIMAYRKYRGEELQVVGRNKTLEEILDQIKDLRNEELDTHRSQTPSRSSDHSSASSGDEVYPGEFEYTTTRQNDPSGEPSVDI